MDLVELPELKPVARGIAERAAEDVSRFNDNRPEVDLDDFSAEQLQELLDWAAAVKTRLTATLGGLENELKNEWFAKEQALDAVLARATK